MALYKEKKFVESIKGAEANPYFDKDHRPGEDAPVAGIYRCTGCGREIGIAAGHKLPAQHLAGAESHIVLWRLAVFADHRSEADRVSKKEPVAVAI